MTELDLLAREIGVSGRTLRRASVRGLVRCTDGYGIAAGERRYLRGHWPILGTLLALLRTESNVRLAVLFGSLARGDARPESDVDLLVRFAREGELASARLSLRLSEALERDVQVVSIDDADTAPLLLADVLQEGRVLVDRDDDWPRQRARRRAIERLARGEEANLERAAWEALDSFRSVAP